MLKPRKKYQKRNKVKAFALLATGVLIIVVVILAISFLSKKNQTISEPGNVPFYVGTSIYKYISFASHDVFVYQLLNYTNCINNTCIVMFGLTTCPHCHAMHEFFTDDKVYSTIYRVFWVDEVGSKGFELFFNLVNIEMMNGVDPGMANAVPQIVIIRNGSIEAIVLGEVRSKDFWGRLLGLL